MTDCDLKNLIAYVIDEFGLPEALPLGETSIPQSSEKPFRTNLRVFGAGQIISQESLRRPILLL